MGIDCPINSSITTSFGSLLVKSFINKFTAKSEIIKIATKKNKKASAGTERIWNNIYKSITFVSSHDWGGGCSPMWDI